MRCSTYPLDAGGNLIVGVSPFPSIGELNITSGGEFTNDYAFIGDPSSSMGQVFVTGTGAKWTNNLDLFIGLDGMAFVEVDDGASIIAHGTTILAGNATGYAQLTLSGIAGARGLFFNV